MAHSLGLKALRPPSPDEEPVQRFVNTHLPSCRCAPRCVRTRDEAHAVLVHPLAQLRAERAIAPARCNLPAPIADELGAFNDYLEDVRCLREVTRQQDRLQHIRHFLLAYFMGATGSDELCGPQHRAFFSDLSRALEEGQIDDKQTHAMDWRSTMAGFWKERGFDLATSGELDAGHDRTVANAIPEPGAICLVGIGLPGMFGCRRFCM